MWALLSRSPGATSQRRYSMSDGQIHLLVEQSGGPWPQYLRVGDHMAPMRPSTPRRVACAFAEPDWPRTAPITATGLLRSTLRPDGRYAQSIALASTPGTVPLYSGVAIRTAFDTASTSSLKKGNWPISKNRTSTHSGANSSAARSSPRL